MVTPDDLADTGMIKGRPVPGLPTQPGRNQQAGRQRLGREYATLPVTDPETTQAYALLADKVADTAIRAARRKREARGRHAWISPHVPHC